MPNGKRGEVWIVDLGMAAKIRPCVIVSIPIEDQDRALVTLIPHTTSVRGSRFEVAIAVPGLERGAFDVQNVVTVPIVKLVRKTAKLSDGDLQTLSRELGTWLGL